MDILVAEPGADFALIDSGGGRKLERVGPYRFIRPEPQAMWAPALSDWPCDAEFVPAADRDGGGRWHFATPLPEAWPVSQCGVRLWAQCTPFRHLGFFPDMAPHWDMLAGVAAPGRSVLNLFGYTGVASLVAAQAGADVVHVDASRKAIAQARANAQLSGLQDAPIRWITDDARKFVAREIRRGHHYHAIFLDPPKFGRGPQGERWDIFHDLAPLLADCARLLDEESALLVLTTYAVRMSAVALGQLLAPLTAHLPGGVTWGEMTEQEEERGLLLPTAIFARYQKSVD